MVMAGAETERLNTWVAVDATLSVTCTVKVEVPAVGRVPEIVPEPDKVKPAGKAPEITDQEYGGVPPAAASCWE